MHQFDDPMVMTDSGYQLPDKLLRLNEILTDMGRGLSLVWIPPENRSDADLSKPYAIMHAPRDRKAYIVMFIGHFDDPEEILARLWEGDTTKHDVMRKVQLREEAAEAFRLRKQLDEMEETADELHFMATNRSNWFIKRRRPDGTLVKIDTQTGREVT